MDEAESPLAWLARRKGRDGRALIEPVQLLAGERLRAVALLKEEPVKAAAIYTEEQRSVGRDVEVAVIDKSLRRIRWEPEITPKMEKYLVDQAKDLTTGAGEGRLKAVPDVAKALNRDLLKKAMAAR